MQSWLVISPIKEVTGKVLFVKNLHSIEQENYKENVIILTETVEGDEEVPPGVTGLILLNDNDYPDILAHVSVRARNGRVLFLVCLEPLGNQANELKKLVDNYAKLSLAGTGLNIKEISAGEAKKIKSDNGEPKKPPKLKMPEDKIDKYFILPEEYTYLKAGGKSNNLNKIRGKVESWINLPECITMQFNSAEDIIASSENSKIKSNLNVTFHTNN